MELHLLDPSNLRWSSSSFFLASTTCSTKVLTEQTNPSNPPILVTNAAKKNLVNSTRGLQKSSKKNLSHILRTEAAISAIERKANSRKHTRLWPKAVLEALDDAIREKRWQSALKVGEFLVFSVCFLLGILIHHFFAKSVLILKV